MKGKLNYFFENEQIPLDTLNNSFMNGMINQEQHEQLRQIITPKAAVDALFQSDEAVHHDSGVSQFSKMNSSYQSSQQLSPEEKTKISKFYDKL